MKTNVKKLKFGIRMFFGSFLILFSGFLTLPIYVSIRHSAYLLLFELIFLCVFTLFSGHWWIKRAYDKNKLDETH